MLLGFLFVLALAGIATGVRLAELPDLSRHMVPFSGGMLGGIAIFWLVPESAEHAGWLVTVIGAAAGFLLLLAIDRALHPVVAGPLLAASSVHAFFDGWSLAVSQQQGFEKLGLALLVGIGVHKIPECIALGALLVSATRSPWRAALSGAAVQCSMFLGAFAAIFMAHRLAAHGTSALLAAASGIFVYLGYHAISPARNWVPVLTGAAGAAALRLVPGL